MNFTPIDRILGRKSEEPEALAPLTEIAAEIEEQAREPERYRPYLSRPRPQMAFAVIEQNGTLHGFMYHQLRHPKHETRGEQEFLSFTADGAAVVMQGKGLRVLALAMLRHTVAELREYAGQAETTDPATRIDRLEVIDTHERHLMPSPHLVKDA